MRTVATTSTEPITPSDTVMEEEAFEGGASEGPGSTAGVGAGVANTTLHSSVVEVVFQSHKIEVCEFQGQHTTAASTWLTKTHKGAKGCGVPTTRSQPQDD